jgi:threonine synthase
VQFRSTRVPAGAGPAVSFREALFRGLAPDGGLYHPVSQPDLRRVFAGFSPRTPFLAVARAVCEALLGEELGSEAIERIVRRAFDFEPVLSPLSLGLRLLELYHGPTCAFKDFGACFQAAAMEELLAGEGRRAVILVATSGDTGSAVARAFHRRANIEVAILYPSGRVSPLQEKQLTTLGGNVCALEVGGSFDDCQRLAKLAFLDAELRERIPLTSANSINLGRLLPQAFYYIYGFSRLPAPRGGGLLHRGGLLRGGRGQPSRKGVPSGEGQPPEEGAPLGERRPRRVRFCVPSGNFGNLTAGVYAWQWGLPVEGFVAATNANDVVPEYLETGAFHPRTSVRTLSNAMDVGDPSNFERLLAVFNRDPAAMRAVIHGERVSDEETRATMRRVYEERGLLLDPHTAVGVLAAERFRAGSGFDGELLVLATAHPGKFSEIVREATGVEPPLPEALAAALKLPKQSIPVTPRFEQLKELLLERYARA